MKKIIVPTDFSTSSDNAIKYALNLAKVFNAEISILHAFYPGKELNTGYMIDPDIELKRRARLEELERQLADKESEDEANAVKISSKFVLGFPIEEIVTQSKNADQIVVMGATGTSGVIGRLFGSVSSNVVQQAECPVLLIPSNANFKSYENVMYASDQAMLDDQVERLFVPWIEKFTTKIHVVHIRKDNEVVKEYERKIFDNVHPDYLSRKDIVSDKVVTSLNEYAEKEQIDLLVLSTRRKSFWENLVHTSITKEMALKPSLPILILHDTDKSDPSA